MAYVYRGDFDGSMIGPDGVEHFYPRWLFEQLKRMDDNFRKNTGGEVRLLRRDKCTGKWAIQKETIFLMRPLWELPAFNPHPKMHAILPGFNSGRSPDSGRRGLIDLLMTGLTANARLIDECASDCDRTELPGLNRIQQDEVNRIIREVKSRRRWAA